MELSMVESKIKCLGFSDLILHRRKELGYSLQKLSDKVNGEIAPSYINRLEKGEKKNPSFDVVCQLMIALELDLVDIFQSFGYGEILTPYMKDNPKGIDMVIQHNQDYQVSVECKSSDSYLNVNQARILEDTVDHIIHYGNAVHEQSYGYMPRIIGLIEDFKKENGS